jgi:hypothetical protein
MVDRGAIANGGLGPANAALLQDRTAKSQGDFVGPATAWRKNPGIEFTFSFS